MTAWQKLGRAMCADHPEEAAGILEGIGGPEAARFLSTLSKECAAAVIERMSPIESARLFPHWADGDLRSLASSLRTEALGFIWQRLDAEQQERLAKLVDPDLHRQLKASASYVPDSVGAMADSRVLLLREDHSVKEAVARIRRAPAETLYYLYVCDATGRLAGVVQMRDLLLAEGKSKLSEIMSRELTVLKADMTREEAVERVRKTRFQALPVVDSDGRFLGVARTEDLLKMAEQEASEDVQKMFGAGGDERALSPIPFSMRARLPWLVVNLSTAFLASAVVGIFTETIALLPLLAVLMPIVAGQGGNTGAQSLAVIIRGLALNEIDSSHRARAIVKETLLGLLNGIAIALITALGAWIWSGNGYYGLVIGVAMVVNMAAAGCSGAMIPIVMKSMGRDPAQSSSIILTTVTDVVGFLAFLGLGTILAPWLRI